MDGMKPPRRNGTRTHAGPRSFPAKLLAGMPRITSGNQRTQVAPRVIAKKSAASPNGVMVRFNGSS